MHFWRFFDWHGAGAVAGPGAPASAAAPGSGTFVGQPPRSAEPSVPGTPAAARTETAAGAAETLKRAGGSEPFRIPKKARPRLRTYLGHNYIGP